jgi:serine/threonine protein kinase
VKEESRFGRYILISKLGMGGMAEVFKAQHKHDPDLLVAIKRILPQFTQDKKLVSMLVNEARLSMGLNHPNIVPVLDFGMVEGDYFIAMEYIKGKDLKSIMIRCKMRNIELPIQMSIFIVSKVLRALSHAHNKRDNFDQPLNIVHRDISPHNILISYWGEVKILDFGIAKASSVEGSTQTGILKGKFGYMSPEQAFAQDVDHKTDLYSAAIVLWELLTLESYYHAESDIQLLHTVRAAEFRDPSQINPKVSRTLVGILEKALQKKPRKRFQDADDFADALEKYQDDTFGEVTEADLAAFIRSLFGISAEEIVTLEPPKSRRPMPAEDEGLAPARRHFASRSSIEIPDWAWKGSLLLLAVMGAASFFVKNPPATLWHGYKHWVARTGMRLYQWRVPNASRASIEIEPPVVLRPIYPLRFSPGVKESLSDLPFEVADRIRIQIDDLTYEARPARSEPAESRPGYWSISQAGFRILYNIGDQPRSITVVGIEKKR